MRILAGVLLMSVFMGYFQSVTGEATSPADAITRFLAHLVLAIILTTALIRWATGEKPKKRKRRKRRRTRSRE